MDFYILQIQHFKKLKVLFFFITISFIIYSNISAAKTNPITETKLPIEFSQGLASTYIYIENKKIPLLLDSGASKYSIVLSRSVLNGLKVKYAGTESCSNTIDGKICMKDFLIPTVKVGSLILHNVRGSELQQLWGGQKGFIETQAARNGLIGLNFLKKFNIFLNYRNHRIIFTKDKTHPANFDFRNCSRIDFKFDKGLLANITMANKKLKLIIDTGSNLSYLMPGKSPQSSLPCNNKYAKEIDNCHYMKTKVFNSFHNYIGKETFYISNMQMPFDGIIGATFIQHHDIFIDSYNRFIYIC
jgi:hypothetical protein